MNSEKCWQYNIDFLRGLACGICESESTKWITSENLILSQKECKNYADSCKNYWKNYYTLYNYVWRFYQLASCKTGENFKAKTGKDYFDEYY